jgi:heme exporter protein C
MPIATSLHRFAGPAAFARLSRALLPFAALIACLGLGIGLYQGLFSSPPDYQQGEAVRIMYIHVPAAALSQLIYAAIALLSASYLIWKHPLADLIAREAAPVGVCFTLITLITGALWGKPMWGAYWVWDARLTSVALLLLLYIGYIALSTGGEPSERRRVNAAWLAIVGALNLPIIKFSVEWWNTLHQPASLLRSGGPTLDGSMLVPLIWCMTGFIALGVALVCVRVEAARAEQKLSRLKRQQMRQNMALPQTEDGVA